MNKKYCLLLLIIVALFALPIFNGCEQNTLNGIATYYGIVMDELTDMPYEGADVKVTDGNNIHTVTKTDEDGVFSVDVRLAEINQEYYFLIGNSRIATKRVEIPSFANGRFDLGIIIIQGPSVPTVETAEVKEIKSRMATGGGKITSSGGFAVTKRGVCWSDSQYPTISGNHTEDGTGVGEYFSNISNLQPRTTYYVRAYAENERGIAYGNQIMFTTSSGVPTVKTSLARVDGKTAIYYEGSVSNSGDSPVTERGICWGTSTPTIANQKTTDGDGVGSYSGSVVVSNVHSQDLYIRAYATNGSGTAYGEAIKIDHRNPYKLPIIDVGSVKYIVLPYDLDNGYMGYQQLDAIGNTAYTSCASLDAYDYTDWELPSRPVLAEVYYHKTEIGGFTTAWYWTSTATGSYKSSSSYYYYKVSFANGNLDYSYGTASVRPVRQY